MSIIARLGAKLGLDTQEFVKGVDAAQQKSKEFKKQLRETQQTIEGMKTAFAAAGAAFIAFAAAAVHAADEVVDLADANETTIGKVLELKYALVTSGGDVAKLGQFYASFTKAIDGAAEGNEGLRDSFAAVGVSIKDIGTLSQDELQNKALRGLASIDDQVKRNALAFELFGKAAKNVNFQAMADNVGQAAGAYDRQADAIKAAADAVGKLELLFGDMQLAALTAIKPVTDLISKIPSENRIQAMTRAFQALGAAIAVAFGITAVGGVMKFASALRMVAVMNPWLLALTAAGGVASYLFGDKLLGMADETPESGSQSFPLTEKSTTQRRETPATSKEESLRAALTKSNAEYQKRLGLLKESIAYQSKDISLLMQKHLISADEYSIAEKKLQLDGQISKLEEDRARELAAAQAEYDVQSAKEKNKKLLETNLKNIKSYYETAIPAQKELNGLILNQLEKEIELKNKYIYQDLENQKTKEQESIRLNHSAQMEMLELESQAYKLRENDYNLFKLRIDAAQQLASIENKYAERRRDLQIEFERTSRTAKDRELFEERIQNLNTLQTLETMSSEAINSKREENFVKEIERQKSWAAGWDQAFKRYTETAERASLRGEAAFDAVMSNMEIALRNFVETGKLNFKDFVGDVVKELLYLEMKAQATMILRSVWGGITEALGMKTLPKKASGGYIDGPAFVGENGPELFIPRTPGTIIPQGSWQQMANSGGGGLTVNGNYIANMSAIDTQSATQFLASNKQTIWAAYQSANRMVPISR